MPQSLFEKVIIHFSMLSLFFIFIMFYIETNLPTNVHQKHKKQVMGTGAWNKFY